MEISSTRSDQKQQNIRSHISLFCSVALQDHHVQRNGGDHDWLIQTPVSTVQWGTLMRLDADTSTPGHTLCIQFSAEQTANVVDLERQWWWSAKVSVLSSNTPRHIASVEILMLMPQSVMVRSQSLYSWCGVPSQMNWVLSWFNFNRLSHIHRLISPTHVTSFCTCLLPMGLHGNTAECRRHVSALRVHVVRRLRWCRHSRREKGQDRAHFLVGCSRSMAI